MKLGTLFKQTPIYWIIAVATLFPGASFLYSSIKAPYYWGYLYVPGLVLLNVWAIATIAGTFIALVKPWQTEEDSATQKL